MSNRTSIPLNLLYKQSFIPICFPLVLLNPGSGVKWLMSIRRMQQAGQTPAMHVNSGPVILIRAFTGQIHQLQFQISATELTVDMSSTTFLNSICLFVVLSLLSQHITCI